MTQREITECNKLLAKFDSRMRFKNDRKNHAEWVGVVRGEIGNAFMSDQLKYHRSWEWIMPVWFEMQRWYTKKYGRLRVRFELSDAIVIYTDDDDAYSHICVFGPDEENDILTEVWTACAGFVKWLYENKNKNKTEKK